jgi:hypothetical protein
MGFPTLEEARANWDKLSRDERKDLEETEKSHAEFKRRKLREPSQLPEISTPCFTLTWDIKGLSGSTRPDTVIRHGETVIFAEPACWEGYERFIEVAKILRRRYGEAIKDLVPTEASELYLYGDRLSSPDTVRYERKRIFSTPTAADELDHRDG